MKLYTTPFPQIQACAIALGTFDGVHTGHRAVIAAAVDAAQKLHVPSAVWCFSDLPRNHVAGAARTVPTLTTPEEKVHLIADLGVDILIMPDPTPELLALSPEEFADALVTNLHPARVHVGYNYTYGKDAAGTSDTLRELLTSRGIPLTVIPPVEIGGVPVSSSAIRRLLASGDTAAAESLLGREL